MSAIDIALVVAIGCIMIACMHFAIAKIVAIVSALFVAATSL